MYYNYDFDIAAIIIYIVVAVNIFRTKRLRDSNAFYFVTLLCFSIATPFLDICSGKAIMHKMSPKIVQTTNILYYISEQQTNFFFLMYVFSQLEMRTRVAKIKKRLATVPILLTTLIIVTNPIHGWLFTYENGVYSNNVFRIVVVYMVPAIYFLTTVLYAFRHRDLLKPSSRQLIYVITIMNTISRVIQYNMPSLLVHCFTLSISVLLLFVYTTRTDKKINPVTGLANRYYLAEKVNSLMYNKIRFGTIFVRIVNYDTLTATYGIPTTDMLIQRIGDYFQKFEKEEHVYSVGNDCFVIIAMDVDVLDDYARLFYDKLAGAWRINGTEIVCTPLITTAICPDICPDTESYRAFLAHFNMLYKEKCGIIMSDEIEYKTIVRENMVEKALEHAIEAKSFEMYYQPICLSETKKFVSAEALVRLWDMEIGFVSPAEFIPLAEKTGKIVDVGNCVLEKVFEFICNNDLEALGIEYLEVNLSTIQCLQRNFISHLEHLMQKYQIDPAMICFEITESAASVVPETFTENLRLLRQKGFKLALDDFGTGYANLQRVISSDFDIIKFDKDMTQLSCNDIRLRVPFEKMHSMFHFMNAKVVAEGVETEEQYEYLKSIGCDYIQGYYFSKPLEQNDFTEFMRTNLV